MPRCKKCLKWVLWGKLSPQGLCADCQQKADWGISYKAEQGKKREALFAAQQAQRTFEKKQAEKSASEAAEKAASAATSIRAAAETVAKPTAPQSPATPARSYTSVEKVLHILHNGNDIYSETVVHYRKMQDMTFLKHVQQGKSYIAFDLETTGLSCFENEIIEIGAVKVEKGEITERFSQLVKPEEGISPFITNLTGISNAMVKTCPAITDVMPNLMAFIDKAPCVAHNAKFDMSFLLVAAERQGIDLTKLRCADSLSISRTYWPETENHKLGTVAVAAGHSIERAHRAVDDAEAVAKIIQATLPRAERALRWETLPNRTQECLKEHAPCMQKDFYAFMPEDSVYDIRSVIQTLEQQGKLRRTKKGSSYLIVLPE